MDLVAGRRPLGLGWLACRVCVDTDRLGGLEEPSITSGRVGLLDGPLEDPVDPDDELTVPADPGSLGTRAAVRHDHELGAGLVCRVDPSK